MEYVDAHKKAQEIFRDVLKDVSEHHLDLPTPCSEWTVRDVIDHVIRGNYRVSGETDVSFGEDPVGLKHAFSSSATLAHSVFSLEDGLNVTYTLPIGEVPGAIFIRLRTSDVFVHAWDLASAMSKSTDLDSDLAQLLLENAKNFLSESLRGEGRPFAMEKIAPEGSNDTDRLCAFLGRDIRIG